MRRRPIFKEGEIVLDVKRKALKEGALQRDLIEGLGRLHLLSHHYLYSLTDLSLERVLETGGIMEKDENIEAYELGNLLWDEGARSLKNRIRGYYAPALIVYNSANLSRPKIPNTELEYEFIDPEKRLEDLRGYVKFTIIH